VDVLLPKAADLLIKRRTPVPRRRNWAAIIDRLNKSPKGEMRIRMGSPGSAQVTRCRLLEQWNNLEVTTQGATLHLRLRHSR
jgi:hypothetical protein